ncbi:hypothetical protein F4604DRAFT_1683483 [Suillus subluteus]|nr:hypothetical protein F4604DRAFT_1683483 [Suillus subluteus]
MLKKGADAARGDDTSSLKELVATWVNQEFHSSPLIKPNDKHLHSFSIVTTSKKVSSSRSFWFWLSKPSSHDLPQQGKLKVMVMELIFSRIAGAPGRNLDRRRKSRLMLSSSNLMRKVRFALSSVTSWHTVDGDFDYEAFWSNTVDFFENVPSPVTKRKVDKLLKWWTRKIFGTNHCDDLTPNVVCQMSVNALAEQRKKLEDAAFDSE